MPEKPKDPVITPIPNDFGDLVTAKRVGALPMYNEWLALGRPPVPPGNVSATYIVDPMGNATVTAVSSNDGNGTREAIMERAVVASAYEPAYITSPYTDSSGNTLPANTPVYGAPKSLTVFWHSPDSAAPSSSYHWSCDQDKNTCEWYVRISEKPSESRPGIIAKVEEEVKSTAKKKSLAPAIIVGAFAGWYLFGKVGK